MTLIETAGKLCVNWLSLRPLLLSQALSSPLSEAMSSDCSHCHTTATELSTLRVALHGIKVQFQLLSLFYNLWISGGISSINMWYK